MLGDSEENIFGIAKNRSCIIGFPKLIISRSASNTFQSIFNDGLRLINCPVALTLSWLQHGAPGHLGPGLLTFNIKNGPEFAVQRTALEAASNADLHLSVRKSSFHDAKNNYWFLSMSSLPEKYYRVRPTL